MLRDLQKKMVLLGGPRQCGKTTFAQSLLGASADGQYFNFDRDRDRKAMLAEQWSDSDPLLVFDEIHKYTKWKNWLKGVYDTEKQKHKILVTGSARLNLYKRGGDSLLGRYYYWRLHPFSLGEIPDKIGPKEALKRLLEYGGFPEPFLDANDQEARRWRKQRQDLILKDDIRDLENIKNITTLTLLVDLLRQRVGSLIVVSNLAQDLQVSPITVGKWIEALEKMYLLFVVRAHSHNVARSLQKPFKVYFYDNAEVDGDEGARFENLVATHLLKRIEFLEDSSGYRYQLCFIRDREKREVDFAIVREKKLEALIEAKWSDSNPSPHLLFFSERLKPSHAVQIVAERAKTSKKGLFEIQDAIDSPWLREFGK